MDGNRLMQQVMAIFSVFMVLFYLGVGIYLVFYFDNAQVDRPVLVILGSTFILYGIFRSFRAYTKIIEVFFNNDDETPPRRFNRNR